MGGGEERKPAGDVLFGEREGLSRKQNEWIKNRAPRDPLVVERVIEMASADWVFGQDQRAAVRVPEGKCPVPNELGKAIGSPFLIGCRDDGNIGRVDSHDISQRADELGTVVEAAVPREGQT